MHTSVVKWSFKGEDERRSALLIVNRLIGINRGSMWQQLSIYSGYPLGKSAEA